MDYDEEMETMRRYHARFGDIGNSRQMPTEVLQRLPEMMADALLRGTPLTNDELQIAEVPPGASG